MCTGWTRCHRKEFQIKYGGVSQIKLLNKTKLNLYLAEKYIFKKLFKVTTYGWKVVNIIYDEMEKEYSGIHIRTYGFYRDFFENPSQIAKNYDLKMIKTEILHYYNRISPKIVYLCSDSMTFKNIVEEFTDTNIKLYFNNASSNHNRKFRKEMDEGTFIDLELLIKGKHSLLTAESTFSLLIYMRNNNCNLNTCKFIRRGDK